MKYKDIKHLFDEDPLEKLLMDIKLQDLLEKSIVIVNIYLGDDDDV